MDDQSSRTFEDLSVQNVAKFLQTVVVVDDKARNVPLPTNSDNTSLPSVAEADIESPVGAHPNLVSPQPDAADSSVDAEDLDAKALVDGFAKEGIACTVLCPYSEDDVVTQVTKVAELADIVVLDWILDRDNGERITKLIRKLISEESGPDRKRLIAIYTGERDLGDVADRVYQLLSASSGGVPERLSDFETVKGPLRLVVFGKEHTQVSPENTDLTKRIVGISELPYRLIQEFAKMTTGILPNVAIAGLSEVRAQTHKLLSMFSDSLDPAYLGHRLLLPNPSEAEEEVVTMLVAEILSILEHGDVAKQAGIDSIRAWVSEMTTKRSVRLDDLAVSPQDTLKFLEDGVDKPSKIGLSGWKWENATHVFTSEDCQAEESNRLFAEMMQMKTRYNRAAPSLTLGTILFSELEQCGTYWICLQPKCDSVRIKEPTAFPLVPMAREKNQRGDIEIVVKHRGCWVLLRVLRRPADIRMFTFEPDIGSMSKVTASTNASSWKITSNEGTTFEWVAELKDEHAQRIANKFAGSFSRVGVNESEWVRRSGAKS